LLPPLPPRRRTRLAAERAFLDVHWLGWFGASARHADEDAARDHERRRQHESRPDPFGATQDDRRPHDGPEGLRRVERRDDGDAPVIEGDEDGGVGEAEEERGERERPPYGPE